MKKYILVLLILIASVSQGLCEPCHFSKGQGLLEYLKLRKDKLALAESEKILAVKPDDATALWVKAEVLRRAYKFKESQDLLNRVLSKNPAHAPSLISLSYIRYHDNEFKEALKILRQVLRQPDLERENKAIAYVLIGSINATRASSAGFLGKITYGTRVLGFFKKAEAVAPDLAEVHLGLGTFYLFAPSMAGGNLDKAIGELKRAVELAPDFATANVRLAQAYKKKGDFEKYNFYLRRTKELDPENKVLKQ